MISLNWKSCFPKSLKRSFKIHMEGSRDYSVLSTNLSNQCTSLGIFISSEGFLYNLHVFFLNILISCFLCVKELINTTQRWLFSNWFLDVGFPYSQVFDLFVCFIFSWPSDICGYILTVSHHVPQASLSPVLIPAMVSFISYVFIWQKLITCTSSTKLLAQYAKNQAQKLLHWLYSESFIVKT